MRIGYRKKIGNFYVSDSVSTKGCGMAILYLFLSPFYLAYYMLVWPCIKIYQMIKKNNRNNRSKKSESDLPQKTKILIGVAVVLALLVIGFIGMLMDEGDGDKASIKGNSAIGAVVSMQEPPMQSNFAHNVHTEKSPGTRGTEANVFPGTHESEVREVLLNIV